MRISLRYFVPIIFSSQSVTALNISDNFLFYLYFLEMGLFLSMAVYVKSRRAYTCLNLSFLYLTFCLENLYL